MLLGVVAGGVVGGIIFGFGSVGWFIVALGSFAGVLLFEIKRDWQMFKDYWDEL